MLTSTYMCSQTGHSSNLHVKESTCSRLERTIQVLGMSLYLTGTTTVHYIVGWFAVQSLHECYSYPSFSAPV